MELPRPISFSSSSEEGVRINVKFNGRTIPISISPQSTIKDLKSLLLSETNVLPRGQKLIFKGKVLEDDITLEASKLSDGSKLMLVASQGLHQGDGSVLKKGQIVPVVYTDNNFSTRNAVNNIDTQRMLKQWKVTGVIALSECKLAGKPQNVLLEKKDKMIPDEVWDCGPSARVLYCNNNSIFDVPSEIARLTGLEKLFLNANSLMDGSLSWEGLTSLKCLTVLSLCQNDLTAFPPELGSLTSLRELHISDNRVVILPDEIGQLTQLEVFRAKNNRLSVGIESIGKCHALVEIDLSSNYLPDLPDTFCSLSNLKALYLTNNYMKSLPSKLFKNCPQLSTLDLHNTQMTIDVLRQMEGWDKFDDRRRNKHQKQLDFRVGVSRDFDEGADKN